MADTEHEEGHEPSDAPKKHKKWDAKTWLMVGGTLAAAVAGWLIYKKSSSGSSATSPTAVVTGGGIAGTPSTSPSAGAPQTVTITSALPTGASSSYTGPPTSVPRSYTTAPPPASSSPSPSQTTNTTQPNPQVAANAVSYATLMQMGQGYSVSRTGHLASGIVQGSTNGYFSTLPTYTSTLSAIQGGQSVSYQSAPGVFTPITSVTQFKKIEPTGPKGGAGDTTTYVKTK